jgi:hypothetical protein
MPEKTATPTGDIWDYIHGFARRDRPELITYFDHYDQQLYTNLPMRVIGEYGWELVSAFVAPDPANGALRYEYLFKRNRARGYDAGLGPHGGN